MISKLFDQSRTEHNIKNRYNSLLKKIRKLHTSLSEEKILGNFQDFYEETLQSSIRGPSEKILSRSESSITYFEFEKDKSEAI